MNPAVDTLGVGAILHTPDGRFLMQLRDDRAGVSMRGHWGLFGGIVEKRERPDRALRRELIEELAYSPAARLARFAKLVWDLGFAGHGMHGKVFYAVPIAEGALNRMRLGEGRAMRLFSLADLLGIENVVPWDAFGLMLFSRRALLRQQLRRTRPDQARRSR